MGKIAEVILLDRGKRDKMAFMSKPTLILVSGPPGAGKSTLARALAGRLRAVILDKDPIDECFSPGNRGPRYSREIEPKVLQALLNLAAENLDLGHTVILDVPWTHIFLNAPGWQHRVRQLAQRSRAKLVILEVVIDEAELRRRLVRRGLDRDQVKLSNTGWEKFRKTDRLGARNPLPHFEIQAQWPRAVALRAALKALRRNSS